MKDPRLERAGVTGFNKPKRTPGHATKSHIEQIWFNKRDDGPI